MLVHTSGPDTGPNWVCPQMMYRATRGPPVGAPPAAVPVVTVIRSAIVGLLLLSLLGCLGRRRRRLRCARGHGDGHAGHARSFVVWFVDQSVKVCPASRPVAVRS